MPIIKQTLDYSEKNNGEKESERQISREDRDLITLAVKCKFIDAEQENELLSCLITGLNEQTEFSVVNIFKGLGFLSQSEIDFLLSIKLHLKTKFLDIRFGKLAIANQFTTPEIIKKALDLQNSHFGKTREHLPIGEILVKNHSLSEPDKTAILLTQDRIADEFLAQALNALGKNELEKLAINKRFASIAVKRKFISMKDMNKALILQKKEKDKGFKPRHLGRILENVFHMSPDYTLKILKEQKIYEKRKLNLEQALFQYNSELKTNQMLSRLFEYHIPKDKLEAHIHAVSDFPDKIHVHNLINWINLIGVRFGIADDETIDEFLVSGKKGSWLRIAQGIPSQQGVNASIQFNFDNNNITSGTNKDRRELVTKGTVVAKRIPHKDGKPGKNVFGQTILPLTLDVCELKCGKGVESKDNRIFIAQEDGVPALYQNQRLFVTPLSNCRKTVKISHDITCKTNNSYQMVNLEIKGKIDQGICVKCQSLKIVGDVFGSIDAADDIEIIGKIGTPDSITGGDEGGPVIKAQGSIYISKSVENAKIFLR